ncbi:uncharacterized protein B0T15DRAFT_525563 [Chaetomium strumarium]|uniref:C2H2-type domain-containing protein n=1 Tax=Chaetomium strumarium TaxID=1170767 RepID=A0AAJ0GZA1_9PEZI|nr:hypothetical protein B0T15DRAFT_525563 [Chaetomium strumarium]
MSVSCEECKVEMGSRSALLAHWQERRNQGKGHYHCSKCMILFHTSQAEGRHQKQLHPAKQELACPGCDAQFVKAGGLIDHIEQNRCPRIKNSDFAARREQKLAFARELQRRHFGEDPRLPDNNLSVASLNLTETTTVSRQGPYNFTDYLSRAEYVPEGTGSLSALRPKAENTVRPNPVTFAMRNEADFPPLSCKQPENLAPGSPAAMRRTANQPQPLEKPGQNYQTEWASYDPRKPGWNAKDYYVTYSGKYRCPHDGCTKSFKSGEGLRGHLLSPAHKIPIRVQCPRCCRWFDSMAAITQHAESQSVRCTIRETDGFRQFLDQLTAGIVDTTEKNADGTERYTVPKEAREVFGNPESKQSAQTKKQDQTWDDGDSWW